MDQDPLLLACCGRIGNSLEVKSLDGDALRIHCEKLDGFGLMSLAKDINSEEPVRRACRDEVHRRECSVATSVAKAEAAGDAAQEASIPFITKFIISHDELIARDPHASSTGSSTRLISVDELVQLNKVIGSCAQNRDTGAVPLSELVEGSLRTSDVCIIGSDHIPPPALHVAELVDQCVACAEKRLPSVFEWVRVQYGSDDAPADAVAAAKTTALHELVGFFYWRLVWIHPFTDGNGRTAHLATLVVAMRVMAMAKMEYFLTYRRHGMEYLNEMWVLLLRTATLKTDDSRKILEFRESVSTFEQCHVFLEFRRLEVRKQLVVALRDTDAAWARMSGDEREKALRGSTAESATVASSPCWAKVGEVLLNEVWLVVGRSLNSLASEHVLTKIKRYRWTNDLGGGDYSTGMTDTPNGSPTWVDAYRRKWRELDERTLRP